MGSITLIKRIFLCVLLLLLASLLTVLFFVIVVGFVIKAHKRRPTTGMNGMGGMIGVTKSELDQGGEVFVHGELWKARAGKTIGNGRKVKVVRIEKLVLTVEEIEEDD